MIKLTIKTVTQINPNFIAALDRLGSEQSIPIKDRFQLALVRNRILENLDAFEQQRVVLVKQYGRAQSEVVKEKIAALEASPIPIRDEQELKNQRRILAEILSQPELMVIDSRDPDKVEKFNREFNALRAIEFEVPLHEKVRLTAECTIGTRELSVLVDLVQM